MGFVDAMETPLDVLSRAATLIHDQLKSASNDDSNQVRRELIGYEDEEEEEEEEREDGGWNSTASKQLPTRAKKERRCHERHCDLISTASRNSRTHRKQAEAAAAAAAGSGGSAREDAVDHPLDMSTSSRRNVSGAPPPPYPHNLTESDRDRCGRSLSHVPESARLHGQAFGDHVRLFVAFQSRSQLPQSLQQHRIGLFQLSCSQGSISGPSSSAAAAAERT